MPSISFKSLASFSLSLTLVASIPTITPPTTTYKIATVTPNPKTCGFTNADVSQPFTCPGPQTCTTTSRSAAQDDGAPRQLFGCCTPNQPCSFSIVTCRDYVPSACPNGEGCGPATAQTTVCPSASPYCIDNILAWQGTTYSRRACATTLGPRQTPLARQAYVTLSPSASLPTGVNNATISGLPIQPAEKDLSRGATIGIAIGVGIGVSLALGCCVGWWRRRHPKRSDSFARIPEKDPVEEDIQEVDQGTEQTIESWVDGVTDDDASDEIGTADVTSLRSSVPGQ